MDGNSPASQDGYSLLDDIEEVLSKEYHSASVQLLEKYTNSFRKQGIHKLAELAMLTPSEWDVFEPRIPFTMRKHLQRVLQDVVRTYWSVQEIKEGWLPFAEKPDYALKIFFSKVTPLGRESVFEFLAVHETANHKDCWSFTKALDEIREASNLLKSISPSAPNFPSDTDPNLLSTGLTNYLNLALAQPELRLVLLQNSFFDPDYKKDPQRPGDLLHTINVEKGSFCAAMDYTGTMITGHNADGESKLLMKWNTKTFPLATESFAGIPAGKCKCLTFSKGQQELWYALGPVLCVYDCLRMVHTQVGGGITHGSNIRGMVEVDGELWTVSSTTVIVYEMKPPYNIKYTAVSPKSKESMYALAVATMHNQRVILVGGTIGVACMDVDPMLKSITFRKIGIPKEVGTVYSMLFTTGKLWCGHDAPDKRNSWCISAFDLNVDLKQSKFNPLPLWLSDSSREKNVHLRTLACVDQTEIWSSTDDHKICVWDAKTCNLLRVVPTSSKVRALIPVHQGSFWTVWALADKDIRVYFSKYNWSVCFWQISKLDGRLELENEVFGGKLHGSPVLVHRVASHPFLFCDNMLLIKQLSHPSLLSVVGGCMKPPCYVTEKPVNGTLEQAIVLQKLDYVKMLRIARGVISLCLYLQRQPIPLFFRSLAPRYIWLDENWNPKVSLLCTYMNPDAGNISPAAYDAPEDLGEGLLWLVPEAVQARNALRHDNHMVAYHIGLLIGSMLFSTKPYLHKLSQPNQNPAVNFSNLSTDTLILPDGNTTPGVPVVSSLLGIPVLSKAVLSSDSAVIKAHDEVYRSLYNPFVGTYLGQHREGMYTHLVFEYSAMGDLATILDGNVLGSPDDNPRLRYNIARDVSEALEYLHSVNFFHCNVCAESVLVTANNRAKLTLSSVATNTKGATVETWDGHPGYAAPEFTKALKKGGETPPPSAKYDVFSYGIFLWELFCANKNGKRALEEIWLNKQQYASKYEKGDRPPVKPTDYGFKNGPIVQKLMERCWHAQAKNRPTFAQIVNEWTSIVSASDLPSSLVYSLDHQQTVVSCLVSNEPPFADSGAPLGDPKALALLAAMQKCLAPSAHTPALQALLHDLPT